MEGNADAAHDEAAPVDAASRWFVSMCVPNVRRALPLLSDGRL